MAIETCAFDSGLQVFVEQVPTAHTTAVNVVVGVGALDESYRELGLSHLLEHVVHRGTDLFTDNDARLRYENQHQYSTGAWTNPNRTLYSGRGPSLEPLVGGLASLIATPTLRDENVAEELSVVKREARTDLDNTLAREYFATRQHMFGDPHGHPVVGYLDQLGYDGDQVRAFHAEHYSLGKIAVIATGKASLDQVVESVGRHLDASSLPPSPDSSIGYAQRSLPDIAYGQPGHYGILGSQQDNVSLRTVFLLDETLRSNLNSDRRAAFLIASNIVDLSVARSLRGDRQLSYDGGFGFSRGHPATWLAEASVTCDVDNINLALSAIDEGINSATHIAKSKVELEILAAEGRALISLDDISSRSAGITVAVEEGRIPLSAQDTVSLYKRLEAVDVADALGEIVALYNTADRYVFVQGNERVVGDLPILRAVM